jgi:hypothetical protein
MRVRSDSVHWLNRSGNVSFRSENGLRSCASPCRRSATTGHKIASRIDTVDVRRVQLARQAARQLSSDRPPDRRNHHQDQPQSPKRTRPDDSYPPGVKVSDDELANINIVRHDFRGECNYTISPKAKTLAAIVRGRRLSIAMREARSLPASVRYQLISTWANGVCIAMGSNMAQRAMCTTKKSLNKNAHLTRPPTSRPQ